MKDNRGEGSGGRTAAAPRCAWLVLGLLVAAGPLTAQLPPASARSVAMGGLTVASARGFGSIAENAAGLAMPGRWRVSLAPLPLRVGGRMSPIGLGDLGRYDGRTIPDAVREEWLVRVEAAGDQRGQLRAELTPVAVAVGSVGFQLSSAAQATVRLNPDATELVLFGNAGRTGTPRDFRLAGSSLDAFVTTTAALAFALPLPVEVGDAPDQAFAAGLTIKYVTGNALLLARDLGSFVSGDPLEAWLRFPFLHADGGVVARAGTGVGLDLGFQWAAPGWRAGLRLENLLETFAWKPERLVFRPGSALLDPEGLNGDVRPRPAGEAPEALLGALAGFGFGTGVAIGLARGVREGLDVHAQLEVAAGGGAAAREPLAAGVAAEYAATPRLSLQAHVALGRDGARLGGGGGLALGRVHLGAAMASGAETGATLMFGGWWGKPRAPVGP